MHPVRTVSNRRISEAAGRAVSPVGGRRSISSPRGDKHVLTDACGSPARAVLNSKKSVTLTESPDKTPPPKRLPALQVQLDTPDIVTCLSETVTPMDPDLGAPDIVDAHETEADAEHGVLTSVEQDASVLVGSQRRSKADSIGSFNASPRNPFRKFSSRDMGASGSGPGLSPVGGSPEDGDSKPRARRSPSVSPRHGSLLRSHSRGDSLDGGSPSISPQNRGMGTRRGSRFGSASNSTRQLHPDDADDERGSAIRARKVSMEMQQLETLEKAYEVNETYRNKQRMSVCERTTTRLLEDEQTEREQQWSALVDLARASAIMIDAVARTRAITLLRFYFAPMAKRKMLAMRMRIQARKLVKDHLPNMKKGTVAGLKKLPAFASWPDDSVQALLNKTYPVCLSAGNPVCLEGDTGDRMYIVESGEVDIYVRRTGKDGKSRREGLKVATLGAPAPFGEYSIVCNEPRFASVYASSEVVTLWAIDRDTVIDEIERLPDDAREELMVFSRARREQNLGKLHPLQPSALQESSVMFKCFPVEALEMLSKHFKPAVIRKERTLYAEGQPPEFLYFVAEGEVTLTRAGVTTKVTAGESFGDMEMLWNERRMHTATTEFVDMWVLAKEDIIEMLPVQFPGPFLEAKAAVEAARGGTATPCDKSTYLKHPLLTKYVAPRRLKAIPLRPRVIGRGDIVVQYGDDFEGPICLAEGLCREQKLSGDTFTKGCVVGVELMLNFKTMWDLTLVAREKCELWVIPVEHLVDDLEQLREAGGLNKVTGDECLVGSPRASPRPEGPLDGSMNRSPASSLRGHKESPSHSPTATPKGHSPGARRLSHAPSASPRRASQAPPPSPRRASQAPPPSPRRGSHAPPASSLHDRLHSPKNMSRRSSLRSPR